MNVGMPACSGGDSPTSVTSKAEQLRTQVDKILERLRSIRVNLRPQPEAGTCAVPKPAATPLPEILSSTIELAGCCHDELDQIEKLLF